ncbi:Hypothetical protein A7982_01035 [Minicystis rosea]|nr:Hypothetical protein A7982_01035 [Minicystis rosea]
MPNVLKYINDAKRFETKRSLLLATMGSATNTIERVGKLKVGLELAFDIAHLARSRADAEPAPGAEETLKNRILRARKALLSTRSEARLAELDDAHGKANYLLVSIPIG